MGSTQGSNLSYFSLQERQQYDFMPMEYSQTFSQKLDLIVKSIPQLLALHVD